MFWGLKQGVRKNRSDRNFAVAGITVRVCAMAACRRSARLAPHVKQEDVTPTDISKKVLLSKSVKIEPQEVRAPGLEASAPPRSGRKRKLGFEKDRISLTTSIHSLPRRKSEKITDSFKVVKQEDCHVDVKPLPVDVPSLRGTKKPKVEATEATDDIKKPIVFVRRERSKTEADSLPKAKVRPTVKREIKREKTNVATLPNVKEERCSPEKVEEGNEIALLATGPSLDVAAQASKKIYSTSQSG